MNIKFDTKKLEKSLQKIVEEKQKEIMLKKNLGDDSNMIILKGVQEECLKIILENCSSDVYTIDLEYNLFPEYIQVQIKDILNSLTYAGYAARPILTIGGTFGITITPQGKTYFEDKEKFIKEQKRAMGNTYNIGSLNATSSNLVFGDVIDSTLIINNSISEIERNIEENGGEDKEELKLLLEEIKDFIDNMRETKNITKNKGLFNRLGEHFKNHQWFYLSVVQLLGQVALSVMSGSSTTPTN